MYEMKPQMQPGWDRHSFIRYGIPVTTTEPAAFST